MLLNKSWPTCVQNWKLASSNLIQILLWREENTFDEVSGQRIEMPLRNKSEWLNDQLFIWEQRAQTTERTLKDNWYENAAHYFSSTFIWLTRLVFNFTDNVLRFKKRFMVVKILEVRCLPETSVNNLTWTYIVISYVTELKHVTCAQIANTKNGLKFTTTCKII